ncbi:hypothetical protein SALBM135S_09742 [Streptomyces alboniger]
MIRAAARRRDADQRDWLLRGTPPPPWVRWPPPLLLAAIVCTQLLTPRTLDLSFLVAAVSPLAALSYGPPPPPCSAASSCCCSRCPASA